MPLARHPHTNPDCILTRARAGMPVNQIALETAYPVRRVAEVIDAARQTDPSIPQARRDLTAQGRAAAALWQAGFPHDGIGRMLAITSATVRRLLAEAGAAGQRADTTPVLIPVDQLTFDRLAHAARGTGHTARDLAARLLAVIAAEPVLIPNILDEPDDQRAA